MKRIYACLCIVAVLLSIAFYSSWRVQKFAEDISDDIDNAVEALRDEDLPAARQALAEGAKLCDEIREGMNHLLRTQDFTELEAALRAADGHLELSAPEEAFGELRRAQVQVETLEWLSSDIFGKVVQIKKGVTIDRDKTSINLNENMDSLVPASKISDMPTGWICGQTARDFIQTKTGIGGSMNVQESEEFKTSKFFCKTDFDMKEIKKEEAAYVPLPKFYTFKSREERERILYRNFVNVGIEVKEMIKDVLNKRGAK